MTLLRESLKKFPDIEIEAFDGLLVDYAVQKTPGHSSGHARRV